MIQLAPIETYNKTLAFVRKNYYSYDNKEMQQLKESAPLLKFTMQPQTLKIEADNIKQLLQIGDQVQAHAVVISRTLVQYIMHINSPAALRQMSGSDIMNRFQTPHNVTAWTNDRLMELKMCPRWDRYRGVLTEGSDASGIYIAQSSGQHTHFKTANAIIKKLSEYGYIAKKGRVPLAVEASVFGVHDIQELTRMLDFCEREGMRGVWMQQLAKQFDRTIRDYRWPTRSQLELRVRKFLRR